MSGLTTLHFLKPGMHTLIQDAGRSGHQASGIPMSGALDKTSAAAANFCVGNPASSPVLEITMIGPVIHFDGDCQIAVTGAEMIPKVNGEPVARYQTIDITSGSELSFGKIHSGCRAYLAVHGEWQVAKWLDARVTRLLNDDEYGWTEFWNEIKVGS